MGGHYAGKATTQKILHAGLWWPTLHKDSESYCKTCDACQTMGTTSHRDELPLNPQVSLQLFEKWAIDFVGPIHSLGKKTGARYIIITTEYLTRWVEAVPVRDCIGETTSKFLFEYVMSRFGCLNILMSDRGTHFLNETTSAMLEEFRVYH